MKVVLKSGTGGNKFEDYLARIPAGQLIFEEGDIGTEMYVIQSGQVDVVKKTPQGEQPLSTLEKGDFFGEMSILEDVPRSATARAKTDCELVRINGSTFDEMLRHNTEIAVRMLRKLSRRLRETTKLLESQGKNVPAESSDVIAKIVRDSHSIFRLVADESGQEFFLNREGETTVGRIDPVTGIQPDVDLTELDGQRSTSRRHAKILCIANEFQVMEEIGTMNGTFVNARRIPTGTAVLLADGDQVRFGLIEMTFKVTKA